jgi:protein-S-isoprenylcysteine O-methyltransferase Ste14
LNLHYPQTLIHWLLAASSAAVVVFFAAGLTLYFERSPRPLWVMLVHYLSMVLAVAQGAVALFFEPRADPFAFVAIAMYVGAIVVFLSAIEAAQRTRLQRSFVDSPLPDRLITDGPFRWVRHPFCCGYLLAAVAGPIGIASPAAIAVAVPLVLVALAAAVRDERVWLSGSRAEEYREYRRRTGMFIPFIGRR